MIAFLPLWLVILVWFAQRSIRRELNAYNAARYLQMIEQMYRCLPVPRSRFDRWLVNRALEGLDKQRDALMIIERLNVYTSGVIPK